MTEVFQIVNLVLFVFLFVGVCILGWLRIVKWSLLTNGLIWLIHIILFYIILLFTPFREFFQLSIPSAEVTQWSSIIRLHLGLAMVLTIWPLIVAKQHIIKKRIDEFRACQKAKKIISKW